MDKKLDNIPTNPGVYFFKDKDQNIIYIGKAKILKNRINSYFKANKRDWKIESLINQYYDIDYIVTKDENEALLLEAQLIKKFKPKYNTLLKDGNPFIYIVKRYDQTNKIDKLELSLIKPEKDIYFGPFINKKKIRSFYEYIIREFRLFTCNKKIANGCLDYHINRCAGSCLNDFDIKYYNERLNIAIKLLFKEYDKAYQNILDNIKKYSIQFEFEKAKKLSKYLNDFNEIVNNLKNRYDEVKYIDKIEDLNSKKETKSDYLQDLKNLSLIFNKNIEKIDCIDISHFQSKFIVGSCIRFNTNDFDLKNSKRYKIKNFIHQDDYKAIQYVIKKRYKLETDLPDLILIDGGKGQLNNAIKALSLKFNNFLCISIAKENEIVYLPDRKSIKLNLHNGYAKLLTKIRDFAHNFAISYHKYIRDKNFIK